MTPAVLLILFYHFHEILRRNQFLIAIESKAHAENARDLKRRIEKGAKFLCCSLRNPLQVGYQSEGSARVAQAIIGGARFFAITDADPLSVNDLPNLSEARKASLDRVWMGMVSGARQLGTVTTDILDFERIVANLRLQFVPESTRLSDVLREVALMNENMSQDVRFEIDVQDDVVAWTDSRRLFQIIDNGVYTSLKHTRACFRRRACDAQDIPKIRLVLRVRKGPMPRPSYSNDHLLNDGTSRDCDHRGNMECGRSILDSGKPFRTAHRACRMRKVRSHQRFLPQTNLVDEGLVAEFFVEDNSDGFGGVDAADFLKAGTVALVNIPSAFDGDHAEAADYPLSVYVAEVVAREMHGVTARSEMHRWDETIREYVCTGVRFSFFLPLDPSKTSQFKEGFEDRSHSHLRKPLERPRRAARDMNLKLAEEYVEAVVSTKTGERAPPPEASSAPAT
eukprot:scaffold1850_cov194-Pinguiococcus_pyrenoidosus.AAC.13